MKVTVLISLAASAAAVSKCVVENCKNWDCQHWCDCYTEADETADIYSKNGCLDDGAPCDCSKSSSKVPKYLMLSAPADKQDRYPRNFGKCEGKCQKDAHCSDSLVCYTTQLSGSHVPGCTGTTDVIGSTQGYCIDPTLVEKLGNNNILEIIEPTFVADTDTLIMYGKVRGWWEAPPEVPFGTCVGGCGSNSHCRDGLKCFPAWNQGTSLMVPGCEGERLGRGNQVKYCYDPNWEEAL